LDYWEHARVLGVTATPDRSDEKALGQIFDDVAFIMDISDGIDAGYLVPIRGKQVHLDEIDISGVKKSKGDLQVGQLDEVMLNAVEGIVHETLRLEPNRQGLAFFPGVRSAEYAADRFNAAVPESAGVISAKTEENERKRIVHEFKTGKIKYLCNCMIATEGFDAPSASMIIQGRLTLSRSLYAQMTGRVVRTLPDLVEKLEGPAMAEYRKAKISASAKPDCMVLDFVGNSGRHSLMSPVDILGGNYSEAEVVEAKKRAKKAPGADQRALLEEARAALLKRAKASRTRVRSRVKDFDPFAVLHLKHDSKYTMRFGHKPATKKQKTALDRFGIPDVDELSKADASKLLDSLFKRADLGLASPRQLKQLQRFGITDINVSRARASEAMGYISSTGWGKKQTVDPATLQAIIHRRRQPGDENE
jgi:superfamily II DNA or RNA helicase